MMIATIAAFCISCLIGAIPFGLLLTMSAGLGDIRRIGSGDTGAKNVLHTGNKKLAAATLLLHGGKGAVGAAIGWGCVGIPGFLFGGLGSVIGHLFPVWLRFLRGCGVATSFGVFFVISLNHSSPLGALSAFAVATAFAILLISMPTLVKVLLIANLVILRYGDNVRYFSVGIEPIMGHKL